MTSPVDGRSGDSTPTMSLEEYKVAVQDAHQEYIDRLEKIMRFQMEMTSKEHDRIGEITAEHGKAKRLHERKEQTLIMREARIVDKEDEIKEREAEIRKKEAAFEEQAKALDRKTLEVESLQDEMKMQQEQLGKRKAEQKEEEQDLIGREEDFKARMNRRTKEIIEEDALLAQKEKRIDQEARLLEEEKIRHAEEKTWIVEQREKFKIFRDEILPKLRRIEKLRSTWIAREEDFLLEWFRAHEKVITTTTITTTTTQNLLTAEPHEATPLSVRSAGQTEDKKWFGSRLFPSWNSGAKKGDEEDLGMPSRDEGADLSTLEAELGIGSAEKAIIGRMDPSENGNSPSKRRSSSGLGQDTGNKRQRPNATSEGEEILGDGEGKEWRDRLRKRKVSAKGISQNGELREH